LFNELTKVLVIDADTGVRGLVREAIKANGLGEVQISESIKSAWSILQSSDELPSWILVHWEAGERFNTLQLLTAILQNEILGNCKVSLLLNEEDLDVIPACAELGILSYHVKPFTQIQVKGEIETLLNYMPSKKEELYKVSNEYLQKYLNSIDEFDTLVELNENLCAKFPKDFSLLLKLAESHYLKEDEDQAKKILMQAKILGSKELELGVKQMEDLIAPEGLEDIPFADAFGFKKIVLVEPDETFSTHVASALEKIGVSDISSFDDGLEAYEHMTANGEPDMIISEWKIRSLNGPALMQRVRHDGMVVAPIVIMSSLFQDKDLLLLKEIGVAAVIDKPIVTEYLLGEVMTVMRKERVGSNHKNKERKIRQLIDSDQISDANKIYNEMAKDPTVPKVMKMLIEAEILYSRKDYTKARDVAMECFRQKGESIITLNLLGKIFLKLQDQSSALKCFNRANQLSSKNLYRLCDMAEAESELGNHDSAKEHVDAAKGIDKDNERVKNTEAAVAISAGTSAKDIIAQLDSLKSLVAYMNNRAVLMVGKGDLDEGFTLYRNALDSITNTKSREYGILEYNLGLAYLRNDKMEEGLDALKKVQKLHGGVYGKAKNLAARIEAALAQGKKISLKPPSINENPPSPDIKLDVAERPVCFYANLGSMCLHLLYNAGPHFTDDFLALLKKMPKFNYSGAAQKPSEQKTG
jgi:DNA-binding response OmpR family regulator